ncbi:MAG: hypothetical protein R3B06_06515 [Kofleriaceae bacterium]
MSKHNNRNAVLRIFTALALLMMSLVVSPTRSQAASANDNFSFSNGSAAKPIRIVVSGNANDRTCGRFIGSLCISDCQHGWTRCLDIQDIFTSVEYTGPAAASRVKVQYTVSIKFDGKKIGVGSRGFTLVNNSTVCQKTATGTKGVKKVTLSGSGSVCGATYGWGSIRPSKATITIDWTYTLDGANSYVGSTTYETALNYDN